MRRFRDIGREEDKEEPSFWRLSVRPEADLIACLAEDGPGKPQAIAKNLEQAHGEILEGYRLAWKRGGSFREARSATEQIDFLGRVLSFDGDGEWQPVCDRLRMLKEDVERLVRAAL